MEPVRKGARHTKAVGEMPWVMCVIELPRVAGNGSENAHDFPEFRICTRIDNEDGAC